MKYLPLILLGFVLISCNRYYSENDFSRVQKIDAHFHLNSSRDAAVLQAGRDNFRLLTINVNTDDCQNVKEQFSTAIDQNTKNPEKVALIATICMENFGTPGWTRRSEDWLDSCIQQGAAAVKVWKNIGMSYRDQSGKLVMIDDPRFDSLFTWIADKKIPVTAHLGEPKNCWLPLKEMTTRNDSSYFAAHPQYHMVQHPDLPSYDDQIQARNRWLSKNPDLKYIGCHLASQEWSVDEIGAFLDKHPNAAVDLAARMGQLFYQTRLDREKVRNFFIKYQDRILYGTDLVDAGQSDEAVFQQEMHRTWLSDWKYFTSDEKMTSPLIHGEFQGIRLPKSVVDKIYNQNAKKWYRM
jgi:hypothetical protein